MKNLENGLVVSALLALLAVCWGADTSNAAGNPAVALKPLDEQQRHARAVQAIKRLGGRITAHEDRRGKRYVAVRIEAGWKGHTTDFSLFKDLKDLRSLHLNVLLEEEALEYVAPLTDLETLWLRQAANITDEAMVHLKRLSNLQRFAIFDAQITLAGMKPLSGLKKLKYVVIRKTRIKYYGDDKRKLKRMLPQVLDW